MNRGSTAIALFCITAVLAWGLAQSTGQTSTTDPPSASLSPRAAASSLAVLDLVRVFAECDQIKDLNELIRRKSESVAAEAAQRKKVIDDKREQLTAFQSGTPDYDARRKELMRLNIEANVWLKTSEDEVETQKFEWTRVIYEKAVKGATDLAQQRGIEAVIQRVEFKPDEIESNVQALRRMIQERTVIYNAPELDITDDVIRRLNAEYKAAGGKIQLIPTTSQPTTP
jgi:Skp family chaperone for outer membrane proteins